MMLTQIELLQGIFSLIFVIISLIIMIKFLIKYYEKRSKEYLLLGFAWLGIASAWIPDALTFIMILIINEPLSSELYFIIGFAFLPALFFCWLIVFTDFVFKEKQPIILISFIIISVIFEIMFIYFLLTNVKALGVHKTPFQVEFGLIMIIYFVFIGILNFITGMIFSIRSLKMEDPRIKLRGKLIMIAFIAFSIAVIFDTILGAIDPLYIIFNRLLLIFSGLMFYMGFMMPEWTKNLFLR